MLPHFSPDDSVFGKILRFIALASAVCLLAVLLLLSGLVLEAWCITRIEGLSLHDIVHRACFVST